MIDKGWGSPTVTKDGVTVAEEIELTDPYENMGAQLVKEAASKTSDAAGDGTTTATVLSEAIFKEGLKALAAGADPMAPKRGSNRRSRPSSSTSRGSPRRSLVRRRSLRLPPSPRTTTRSSARSWPTPSRRSAPTVSSPLKKARGTRPPSTWSRACSSTGATSRPTSSPIRTGWKSSSKTPTS